MAKICSTFWTIVNRFDGILPHWFRWTRSLKRLDWFMTHKSYHKLDFQTRRRVSCLLEDVLSVSIPYVYMEKMGKMIMRRFSSVSLRRLVLPFVVITCIIRDHLACKRIGGSKPNSVNNRISKAHFSAWYNPNQISKKCWEQKHTKTRFAWCPSSAFLFSKKLALFENRALNCRERRQSTCPYLSMNLKT